MSKINLSPISGFREFSPGEQITFNRIIGVIKKGFEAAGAVPIETAAVERVETLLAKGAITKEVYGLKRLKQDESSDDNDLALHFDLTVPLARYVVQRRNELTFPFKRYQIQPVWRGERAQANRYRQFYQCDIDVIGKDELSFLNDAEMLYVIYNIFQELNIGPFLIRINNRKVIVGFLKVMGVSEDAILDALTVVDDLEKVGTNETVSKLKKLGISEKSIKSTLEFFEKSGTPDEIIQYLRTLKVDDDFLAGVAELESVVEAIQALGIPQDYYCVDLSVARGLDYYTSTTYECRLVGHAGVGSICSGGRYDDLASNFTGGAKFPGVGISIGLTRLFPKLLEIGVIEADKPRTANVMIAALESSRYYDYLKIGTQLRNAGIPTEVYVENKKLSSQMKYANRKGIKYVVLIGENEFSSQTFILRDMETGDQTVLPISDIVNEMRAKA